MGLIFKDHLHDEFATLPLGYIPYGGADFGEVAAVGRAVGDGDDTAFYNAWVEAADRLAGEGRTLAERGRRASARDLFLRASRFYGISYRPLYGRPVDPRLVAAFRKQMDVFNKGLALRDPPAAPLRIPFEGTSLPAYFIPAVGHETAVRPLLICTNGYDATITDMFFASAVAATARGYHCLIFDGPGQGEMLIEHGMSLRPDWETVVKAVVDFALTLSLVDPACIALAGWSLGGYLAPRAASGEHRLAACIADPGLWSMTSGLRAFCEKLGLPAEAAANPADMEQPLLDKMWEAISADRKLRWTIIQRGFWANGVENLREFLRCIVSFTLDGRAELIRCPTLITHAEDDPLAASAQDLFDALRCPKTLVRFRSAEGAGTHCEILNRSAFIAASPTGFTTCSGANGLSKSSEDANELRSADRVSGPRGHSSWRHAVRIDRTAQSLCSLSLPARCTLCRWVSA